MCCPGLLAFFKFILNCACIINVQGRELYLGNCMKNIMFQTGFGFDIYTPVSFKRCMIINMSRLFILIPV